MKKKKKEINIIKLFLDFIIIVFAFLIFQIVMDIRFISDNQYEYQIPRADMIYFMLENGRLDETLEVYHFCEKSGREMKKEKKLAPFCAMGEYLEEASYYRVYLETEEYEKASECRKQMQEAKTEMGELNIYADKIDRMVGIEQ